MTLKVAEIRRLIQPWIVFAAAGIVLLLAWFYSKNANCLMIALLPCALAIADLAATRRTFGAEFHDDRLVLTRNGNEYDYESVERLEIGRMVDRAPTERPSHFPIGVYHRHGVVIVPKSIDVPSSELYQFVQERLDRRQDSRPIDLLSPFFVEQGRIFGPERVWAFGSRTQMPFAHWARRVIMRCIAAAIVGIVWIAIAENRGIGRPVEPAWVAAGGILLFVAFSFLSISVTLANPKTGLPRDVRKSEDRGLVISPGGFAMVQGDLKGEILWEEIKSLTIRRRAPGTALHSVCRAIVVGIEGSQVIIYDVYDRPIWQIHDRLMAYWRGGF